MKTVTIGLAAVGLALAGIAATAQDKPPFAMEIKARQGVMNYNALNIGVLGGMAKGEIPYDADQAKKAADNLMAMEMMDVSMLWPQGSDNSANPATHALPAIWAADSDIGKKIENYIAAIKTMQGAAGTDLASLQGAMDGLGGACGACHKAFRASLE